MLVVTKRKFPKIRNRKREKLWCADVHAVHSLVIV